ncbi:MAG: hypothetical protein M3Z30_09155, partial [Gemmatimonadota bacterium]|nr:hypothetical protein [Gemmatimonadota bacterium]
MLRHLGADPDFADAVLGDLAEEYAYRTERDGSSSARCWYAGEAIRSAPHFVRSWYRYAQVHARGQIVAVFAGIAATSFVVVLAIVTRDGPPARLEFGASNEIVINNEEPVHIPVRVLDARGHTLEQPGMRFRYLSGAPIRMSANGIVTCSYMADALVRVSVGDLNRDFLIRCRPIRMMDVLNFGDFIEGDPPTRLNLVAQSPDGRSVGLVAGTMTVTDTTVASLDGLYLRPRAPGFTRVIVSAGDRNAVLPVEVLKRRNTPSDLKPFQAFSAPLEMHTGETKRWSVGRGLHIFSLDDGAGTEPLPSRNTAAPGLTLASLNANCVEIGSHQRVMCAALK